MKFAYEWHKHAGAELIPAELTTQLHKILRYQVYAIQCDDVSRKKKKKHVNSKQEQRKEKNRFELQCGNANIRQR